MQENIPLIEVEEIEIEVIVISSNISDSVFNLINNIKYNAN